MDLVPYAIVIVLIAILALVGWQIWCVFALNVANPVLQGLHAPTVSTRMCGRTSNLLQSATNWAKGLKFPEIPALHISISIDLLVNIGISLILIAVFIALLLALNELLKSLKDGFLELWKSLSKFLNTTANPSWLKSILVLIGTKKRKDTSSSTASPNANEKRITTRIHIVTVAL